MLARRKDGFILSDFSDLKEQLTTWSFEASTQKWITYTLPLSVNFLHISLVLNYLWLIYLSIVQEGEFFLNLPPFAACTLSKNFSKVLPNNQPANPFLYMENKTSSSFHKSTPAIQRSNLILNFPWFFSLARLTSLFTRPFSAIICFSTVLTICLQKWTDSPLQLQPILNKASAKPAPLIC